jgi:YegS/Rv2252/BmrU family lipid kinase
MSENKKVFFIVNKFSGTGYKDSVEGRILSRCASLGLEPTIEFTKDKGHATELARTAASDGFNRVFAVGGDGTVNETAQGLIHTTCALGILPKGSGNGLARHLGISTTFKKALQLIGSEKTISIDTALINDLLSVNVAGIGFDGHVAALFGNNGKRGLPGYAKVVLNQFNGFQEFGGKALVDGESLTLKSFIIAIANSSQFGNNAKIAPYASVCDAELDLCLIKKPSFVGTLALLKKMFSGEIDTSSLVSIRKMKSLELTLEKPVHFHIDGEPYRAEQNFRVQISPASLQVIVPDDVLTF